MLAFVLYFFSFFFFSNEVPNMAEIWEEYVGLPTLWGTRLFFSATIAFGFPKVGPLFQPESIGKAAILVVYCVVGKVSFHFVFVFAIN
jgi:hypothetical protein